jgi:ABC-type glycerol-3-phosphate transport system substrate-binding protein
MLEYFRELDKLAQKGWRAHKYLDTYNAFARGDALMHPVGFARQASFIERYAKPELKSAEAYRFVPQMRGPSGQARAVAYDGEPWVIFKGATHPDAAKAFLKTFYRPDLYREYTLAVPIHLTPILKPVAEDPAYLAAPFIQKWRSWHDHTVQMLREGRAFPTMTTSLEEVRAPFLVEWLGSKIISDMVLDVLDGKTPATAAARAQERSEEMITKLGYKKW